MASGLPIISGRDAIRAFERAGFTVLKGRGKGSHTVMSRAGHPALLTVPDHNTLKRGTLRALIRLADLTVDEFVALL